MILDLFIKNRPIPVGATARAHLISFFKGVSWRIVGTIDTAIISYFITGQWKFALSIASVEVVTKIILFYFHDRLWAYFTQR